MTIPVASTVPVTVLTGFLGSGKTTVLSHLLRQPNLADTVVIVNEFGEVGIDHLLIERADENLVLLDNGCVCCTVRSDLVETLHGLAAQRQSGRIAAFRRIVVETTGLADPVPILHTLIVDPEITQQYRLKGVIATVDGVNGEHTLNAHAEAVRQAAMADCIILTKGDLASADTVSALDFRLRALNPGARIVKAIEGRVDPVEIFSPDPYDPDSKTIDVQRWLRDEAHAAGAHGDHDAGEAGHDHAGHHDEHIRADCFVIDVPLRWDAFRHWLEVMVAMRGEQMLRVKGLVAIAEQPDRPMVVHGVQNIFHPPKQLDAWPSADHRTRLVFITLDIERGLIERMLSKFAQVDPSHIAAA